MRGFIIGLVLGIVIGVFGFKVCVQKTLDAGSWAMKNSAKIVDSANGFVGKVAK